MTEASDNLRTHSAKTREFIKEKNTTDFGRDIFSRYHRKIRDEIELSEADFYEDNIYDEPEYWRTPQFREYNESHHDIRH